MLRFFVLLLLSAGFVAPLNAEGLPELVGLKRLIAQLEEDDKGGLGVVGERSLEAARAARALSPGRWQSWGLNLQGQAPQSPQAEAGEQQLTFTLSFALGSGPTAQAYALERGALEVEAGERARRAEHISASAHALCAYWASATRAKALEESARALKSLATPLLSSDRDHGEGDHGAEGAGLSRLDALDLSLALSAAEGEARRAAAHREAALEALNGALSATLIERVRAEGLRAPQGLLSPLSQLPPQASPWREVLTHVNAHPQLALLGEQAAHLEARAEASHAAYPWSVTLGAGVNLIGQDRWAMGTLSLSAPLSTPADAEQARLTLAASAVRAERAWALRRLSAQLEARSSRWSAERAHLAQLTARLEVLTQRQSLALEAVEARHAPISRALSALEERAQGAAELAERQAALWAEAAEALTLISLTQAPSLLTEHHK